MKQAALHFTFVLISFLIAVLMFINVESKRRGFRSSSYGTKYSYDNPRGGYGPADLYAWEIFLIVFGVFLAIFGYAIVSTYIELYCCSNDDVKDDQTTTQAPLYPVANLQDDALYPVANLQDDALYPVANTQDVGVVSSDIQLLPTDNMGLPQNDATPSAPPSMIPESNPPFGATNASNFSNDQPPTYYDAVRS